MDLCTCNHGYLAMYNVKGIQQFIFSSDKLKEIIGASEMVENVVLSNLEKAMKAVYQGEKIILSKDIYIQKDAYHHAVADYRFGNDESVKAEIIYQGGGNIVAVFREKEKMEEVNKLLGASLLLITPDIVLLTAYVDLSDNYAADQQKLHEKIQKVTENMPPMNHLRTLPITMEDAVTGEPLTFTEDRGRKMPTGRYHKLRTYQRNEQDNSHSYTPESGLMAVIHADGNNMGIAIANSMKGVTSYMDGVRIIRSISVNVDDFYGKAFDDAVEIIRRNYSNSFRKKNEGFLRKIIHAGDDVTFLIRADLALPFVEELLRQTEKYCMLENNPDTRFHSCAGIAYVHSHFPISEAYKVAEALCESAKKRAKQKDNRDKNGKAMSYLDFHICLSGVTDNLAVLRQRQYYSSDSISLLARPYAVTPGNEPAIEDLDEALRKIRIYPRSKQKGLRDAYYGSETDLKAIVTAYNSRLAEPEKGIQPDDLFRTIKKGDSERVARYYDALEITDLVAEAEGGDDHEDQN